ncbi:hypothetical protein BST94_13270 [Nonlabens xylanidelens]|nr:hypothetical protein BST94_13270 [Nonlabens xylanidelens]
MIGILMIYPLDTKSPKCYINIYIILLFKIPAIKKPFQNNILKGFIYVTPVMEIPALVGIN